MSACPPSLHFLLCVPLRRQDIVRSTSERTAAEDALAWLLYLIGPLFFVFLLSNFIMVRFNGVTAWFSLAASAVTNKQINARASACPWHDLQACRAYP